MAAAIERLLTDADRRRRLAEGGRARLRGAVDRRVTLPAQYDAAMERSRGRRRDHRRRQPAVVPARPGRRLRGVPGPAAHRAARRRPGHRAAARAVPPGLRRRPSATLAAGHDCVVGRVGRPAAAAASSPNRRGCPASSRGVDVVHHGGGTVPPRLARPDRADDPRPAVPPLPASTSRRADGAYLARRCRGRPGGPRVIAVPSEFVRGTVVDAFGVGPERSSSCPTASTPAPATLPPEAELRRRYGLGDRRVLVFPADHPPPQGSPRSSLELLAGPWTDPDLVARPARAAPGPPTTTCSPPSPARARPARRAPRPGAGRRP